MKDKNGGDLNVVDTSCDCYTFYDKNGLLYGYLHMRHDCWFVLNAYSVLLVDVCGIERIDNQNVDGNKIVILTAGSRIHKLLPRNVVAEKQAIDKKIDSFKSLQQMDYNTWINKTRAVKITAKKGGE